MNTQRFIYLKSLFVIHAHTLPLLIQLHNGTNNNNVFNTGTINIILPELPKPKRLPLFKSFLSTFLNIRKLAK